MVEKAKKVNKYSDNKSNKSFISYLDDDSLKKDQYVIILNKDVNGVTFKFNVDETKTIFIPFFRILKIKEDEGVNER